MMLKGKIGGNDGMKWKGQQHLVGSMCKRSCIYADRPRRLESITEIVLVGIAPKTSPYLY